MKRPVIGLIPLVDQRRNSYWMLPGYMEGLEAAGAIPLMLPLTEDGAVLRQLAGTLDGLLFTGGQDVEPGRYGETPLPPAGEYSPARDAMEGQLLALALERDLPVLGVCRGLQFLNVALGGSLYQDLPTQCPSGIVHCQRPPYDVPVHAVRVLRDTPLHSLLGTEELRVNSYHHQAVKDLSPRLRPMALSEDGLVEGAWLPGKRFVWGVQWHPEFAWRTREDCMAVFVRFVAASGAP